MRASWIESVFCFTSLRIVIGAACTLSLFPTSLSFSDQTRVIFFSSENVFYFVGSSWKWKSLSCVRLFATPWTIQSMKFSRPEYWSGQPFPSPGDLPNPGIEARSPALRVDSLPAEPQGKPKITGVGSLSLLQGIFPTQGLNRGLLHCRWILYQRSYQGSPVVLHMLGNFLLYPGHHEC